MPKKSNPLGGVLGTIFEGVESDGQKTFFLSQDIQAKLANRLNAVIDLPFFNENQEKAIFVKIVRSLDKHTFRFIPKEILQVAFTSGKALPAEIVDAIRHDLPGILAAAVPLPFVPPAIRQAILAAFLTPLLTALSSGHTIGDLLKKHA